MSVIEGQERLILIAKAIKNGHLLSVENAAFISDALIKIAEGEKDIKLILNIKAKRGEQTSKRSQEKLKRGEVMKYVAMGWIATAIAPENQGGLGY